MRSAGREMLPAAAAPAAVDLDGGALAQLGLIVGKEAQLRAQTTQAQDRASHSTSDVTVRQNESAGMVHCVLVQCVQYQPHETRLPVPCRKLLLGPHHNLLL
jgi:hypothetical protein